MDRSLDDFRGILKDIFMNNLYGVLLYMIASFVSLYTCRAACQQQIKKTKDDV